MSGRTTWQDEARGMVAQLPGVPTRIAEVMRSIPRHAFVPEMYRSIAYDDEPVPLPFGDATVSAPHMVALQLEYADLSPGLRVLEIGSGFGYLAALAAELVGPTSPVFGMDVEAQLVREATRRLSTLGYRDRVELRTGDGREGWPESAPFDRIIVSCATPEIYPTWREQLAPRGLVVAPVGDAWEQRLDRYRNDSPAGPVEHGPRCRFVPLRTLFPSDI